MARPANILVVDDEPDVREMLQEALTEMGCEVLTAASGREALQVIERGVPDLVITDVHMHGMSGVELCSAIKADPRFQLIPVVILTAVADLDDRVAGLAAGADDFFAKPVDFLELRTRVTALLKVKALLSELERAEHLITTLCLTIEARDPYTGGHCERLGRYATALGAALHLDKDALKALWLAGFLHDLGKIAVPDGILLKPGALDAAEREKIKIHPGAGADLVSGLQSLQPVLPFIRHHHERLDGSGYPGGLRGDAIPLGARIMAVVDVYDALHTARPYKKPLSHTDSVNILKQEADKGFWDGRVVTAFVDVLKDAGADRAP
jgi:putative two-component system response regulator